MAGSLWRQKIGEGSAQQLTAAAAYDYQPDWSPDGRWVIYCSYRGDAIELWLLDLQSGATQPLTQNGAVNTEPRFSPDGKRVVFTSTLYNKRFHVFTADFGGGKLANIRRLTGEHKSDLPRYYYSPFDHEINPVWTRDGREIIYVSNRNHIYGTGGFLAHAATPGAARRGTTAPDAPHGRGAGISLRGNELEGASRRIPRRFAAGLQLLSRARLAQPVAPAGGRRRCVSDRLRRLGHDLSALVAGRDAHRLHLEQERRHGNRSHRDSGRPGAIAARTGAPLPAPDGAPAPRYQGCARGIPPGHASASPMRPAGSTRRRARGSMRTTASIAAGGPSRRIIFTPRERRRSMCPQAPPRCKSCMGSSARSSGDRWRRVGDRVAEVAVNLDEGTWAVPDGRSLGERGRARAHELRRHLPQYAGAPGDPGARRKLKVGARADRQQGAALPRHRLQRLAAGPGVAAERHHRARAGISHQLLGTSGIARHRRRHHPAGLRRLSRHRRIEPVSDECGRGGHGSRPRRVGGLRASLRRGSRTDRQAAGGADQ